MTYTTIIIDDESLARDRVRAFLKSHDHIKILAEASNGSEGLEVIQKHQPDFIFLDIQMPEMDGFTMLSHLSSEERPHVIFTTAFDEFAIKAFEINALDYLLKPFSKERFSDTLKRATSRISGKSEISHKLNTLLNHLPSPQSPTKTLTRLSIKDQGKMYFVPLDDILWINAAGNYVEIHDASRTHLLRETMTNLEKRLPANEFIRINRSSIVKISAISEIRSNFKGDHHVILTSGNQIKCTIPLKEIQSKLEES